MNMNKRKKNTEEIEVDKRNLAKLEKLEGKNALQLIDDFASEMSYGADITSVSCGVVLKLMDGIPCQLQEARKRINQLYVGPCWEEDTTASSFYQRTREEMD